MAPALAIHITPRAERQLTGAFEWYEAQRRDLGVEFLGAVEAGFTLLRSVPGLGVVVRGPVRRYLLSRFPYGVFYGIDGDAIVVVAVIHAHRHPRLWPRNLNG